jgi:hypothetical protein
MAVLNLQPTRPRRKPPHPHIYEHIHARMADVAAIEIIGKKTLEVPETIVDTADDNNNDSASDEDWDSGKWKSDNILHHEVEDLRQELSELRARLDAYDGKSTFEQLYTQMQRVIEQRVKEELTRQVFPYILSRNRIDSETATAQKQTHDDITNIQRELLGLSKTTNLRVDVLERTVAILHDENNERKTRKAIPWHKQYTPLRADADAAALPALLAELKAAE